MQRFLYKFVYQIVIEGKMGPSQFDEQFRIIYAENASVALAKAQQLGEQEETRFWNTRNEEVNWELISVLYISSLDQLKDGALIFSQNQEFDQPFGYIQFNREQWEAQQFQHICEGEIQKLNE